MTGRMTAAAAFACLLGLAACGGGGGGGGGGPTTGAGGGSTTMEPDGYYLVSDSDEADAAQQVQTIEDAITAAPSSTSTDPRDWFALHRLTSSDLSTYSYNLQDPDSPIVTVIVPGSDPDELDFDRLGDNA